MVNTIEPRHISIYESARMTWDILKTTYDGTTSVNMSKIKN